MPITITSSVAISPAPTTVAMLGIGLPDLLLVIGIILVTTSLMMRLRKRRRSTQSGITPQEQIERNQQHRGLRGDLESLMVDIEQLAKRMGAQLDAKSLQLERLIHDADQRIEQLSKLQQNQPTPDSPPPAAPAEFTVPIETSPPAQTTDPSSPNADPLARSIYDLADQGIEPPAIAQQLQEHVGKVELILALRQV